MREVRGIVKTRTRAEWLARFDGADACLTSVYTRDEVVNDPHLIARGVVTRARRASPTSRRQAFGFVPLRPLAPTQTRFSKQPGSALPHAPHSDRPSVI